MIMICKNRADSTWSDVYIRASHLHTHDATDTVHLKGGEGAEIPPASFVQVLTQLIASTFC